MSGRPPGIDLTTKERIELHLLERAKYSDDYSVPPELTQSGIAEKVGIHLKHLSQYIRPLIEAGRVQERMAHVVGGKQRRKVYFLTGEGRIRASKIKDFVLGSTVSYMTATSKLREGVLQEVIEKYSLGRKITDILEAMDDDDILDMGALMTAEEGKERMVDHSDDAPKVIEFYGRAAEIESVLSLLDDSGVLVVRGLPGIGKTVLASVICSQIRDRRNVLWHQTRKWDDPSSILLGIGRFLRANGKYRTYEHVSSGRSLDLSRVKTLLEREFDDSNSVMFFDDFQNADSSVLDLFSMLVDVVSKADGTNIIVLSREAVPFYDRRDVKIRKTVKEMELKGIDFESAKKWMQNKGVVDDYEEIHQRTGGHPLFLELATSYMEKIA